MYNSTRRPSLTRVLASVLMLLATSCTGGETTSEKAFLAFSVLFGIVVIVLAVTLFLTLVGSMVVFLLRSSRTRVSESDAGNTGWHIGLIAASIALFGILTSGIFVFMTLQINTTAERTALQEANRTATQYLDVLEPRLRQIAKDASIEEARKATYPALEILTDTFSGPQLLGANEDPETVCSSTLYRPSQTPGSDDAGTQVTCQELGFSEPIVIDDDEREVTLLEGESKRECFDGRVGDENSPLRTYRIEARGENGLDPIISLYRSNGSVLHIDDDGGQGLDSCFEVDLPADAYILEIREVLGNPGSHRVMVQERMN